MNVTVPGKRMGTAGKEDQVDLITTCFMLKGTRVTCVWLCPGPEVYKADFVRQSLLTAIPH